MTFVFGVIPCVLGENLNFRITSILVFVVILDLVSVFIQ
jgi:hypothetical protein